MVNIKVAVRIRPLSERELLQGEEKIVRRENNSVVVTNPKIPERQDGDSRQRTRRFAVDFCYDPTHPESCTQESVYRQIGSEVLHSIYEGYNSCVLAYGPSASGKTYTIMGLQGDPGLTPRLCEGLFEKLTERKRPEGGIRIEIIISFLEIYNEKVRDLLSSEETGGTCANFSLRVREHPKLGPYVQGLSQHSVTEKGKLLELLALGNRRRSTAATENNIHSSRSHAVFTIQLKQSDGENYETEKSSKVHLVDLAGSERANASQNKTRLQEGANINKSLVTLGNVISALAESCDSGIRLKDHSNSKTWQPFVPYRDSVLTWLLKDTLGGNSNTIMIATISPAGSCLSETVNTLRYAKRTKKIVNQPVVNEDPKVQTIRELRKEVARLKGLLIFLQSPFSEENRCESAENILKETNGFYSPNSKWTELEETHNTNTEWNFDRKENWKKKKIAAEETKEDLENKGEKPSTSEEWEARVCKEKGNGCEINDEKKSDVNGSVNDNFSHETQIFSDSLESFKAVESRNLYNICDNNDLEKLNPCDDEGEMLQAEKLGSCYLMKQFCSYENLSEFPEMIYRSRPDLIKGISTKSKEGLPLESSQSYTNVSDLSHSVSENSLNSSGSAVTTLSGNKSLRKPRQNKSIPLEERAIKEKNGDVSDSRRNDDLEVDVKKKENRLESRLHVAKKNQNFKTVAKKNDENGGGNDDNDGESEEQKLCIRTRMKLFDLSRKLSMTRKMKKTVDSDTQTDRSTGTLRVKEKCVTTEPSGESFEVYNRIGTPEKSLEGKKEPYMIMNQVFIPRASSYVVECGKVVRIEAPETTDRQECATQTSHELGRYSNANTSPIKYIPEEEDCFSEDSLDLDLRNRNNHQTVSEEGQEAHDKAAPKSLDSSTNINFSSKSDLTFKESKESGQNLIQGPELGHILLEGLPLMVFLEKRNLMAQRTIFSAVEDLLGSKQEENMSSENSFSTVDSSEINSVSETSSEDFVFLESLKDTDFPFAAKVTSERELYTITENSEQSDRSDEFSTVQMEGSSLKLFEECKKWTRKSEKESAHVSQTFDELKKIRERATSPLSVQESIQSKCISAENTLKAEISNEPVTLNLTECPYSNERPSKFSDMQSTSSSRATCVEFQSNIKEPNFGTKSESEENTLRCHTQEVGKGGSQIRGSDFQLNSNGQYLNLNISNSDRTPFSVDTHLFGKTSKKDQSTDTMSTSADSITFVFMGPAKPKTSVLIELVKRSLGENFYPSEIPMEIGQRKCRSQGVQCDANLMRSVSVDTAMMALSRIAKNQESYSELQKANSLGALSISEMIKNLGGGYNKTPPPEGFESDAKTRFPLTEVEKCAPKHSFDSVAVFDECRKYSATKTEKQEMEKPKKSVSWFGDARRGDVDLKWKKLGDENREGEELTWERRRSQEPEMMERYDLPERRVRFLKPEERVPRVPEFSEAFESTDTFTAFLKEATHLLKSINSRSSNSEVFGEETTEDVFGGLCRSRDDGRRGAFKTWKKSEGGAWNRAEGHMTKEGSWRSKVGAALSDENHVNLTWPRRRPTVGKPPTGTKSKFSRSFLPSRFDSSHPNGFVSFTANPRTWSPSSRTDSGVHAWNLSNISVPLNNSCLGETRSYCNNAKLATDSCFSSVVPKENFDPFSDLETDLEECCRRLEKAMEMDEMREKNWESRNLESQRKEEKEVAEKSWQEIQKSSEAIKRRKNKRCAGCCICETTVQEPCKWLLSKSCRSSFELDTFGPGRAHCTQLCMFCRKIEEESYYSALNLNSVCSSELCRLNYYGYCPCSPIKLNKVVSSPRAYMQHLLTLRKQIVTGTKRLHLDAEESVPENHQNFSWLAKSNFSLNVNEI